MKSKKMKALLSGVLATSVTLSNIGAGIVLANENENTISSQTIEGLMSKIADNEKNYLDVKAGEKIKLTDEVNLNSNESIEIIVELISEPIAVQRNKSKKERSTAITDLEAEHAEFKNQLNKSKAVTELEFGYEFTEVFNGIAMTIPANEVKTLAEMDIVKAIWNNAEVQLEIPEEDSSEYFTTDGVTPFMFDSIPGIGVDKLHDEDIKGANIKVGVLDTGVDYNHPDLKSAYKGGYDFIDNDTDPMETTYEEWLASGYPEFNSSGNEYYTSHGTHVSGTILGRGENEIDTAITGVAPKADLYAYRVLGKYGSGPTAGIIAAIDQAVKDEMDVINLSLGISTNDPLSAESVAINNCMLYTDTVAVVAAGNTGSEAYTVGSPSAAPLAITVGANNSIMTLNTIEGKFLEDNYNCTVFAKDWNHKAEDLLNKNYPIEYVGLGTTTDFEGKDLSGKIALIERGSLAFVDKIANAKNAGAIATIIYNNVEGDISLYLGESNDYILSLAMNKEQGEALKDKLISSEEQEISFDNIGTIQTDGNKLTDYSSRGPVTNSLDIKPELTAPGDSILSTVPGYINDREDADFNYDIAYGRMSGTSMATPHITGVVALMLSEHEDYSPLDVKAILMNTTEELNGEYSVFEVGAGRVNAYEAVKSELKIQVKDLAKSTDENGEVVEIDDITGDFSFGRQGKDVPVSRDFTVTNNSSEDKEFKVETFFSTSIVSPVTNPEEQGVTINIPQTIAVQSGQTIDESMEITIPMDAMDGTYEGYVILTNVNDESEDYRLPFAINVGKKFINVEVLDKAFSLGEFHPYQAMPGFYVGFEVSDQFDSLDVLIKDGETGEYIGYVGSLLTDILPTNTYLEAGVMVSYGYYTPILKNANGEYYIDVNTRKLSSDKRYTIEFLAVDKSGEVIKNEDDYFIDSIPPTVTMDEGSEPGIYEIEYDEANPDDIFRIYGKVYDEYVDYAKSFGFETSQADNMLGYLESSDSMSNQGVLVLGEDGKINVGYPTSQINEEGVINLQMYPIDRATSGNYRVGMISYNFIKKGLPYISATCEKTNFKVGDSDVVTMKGKYLTDFKLSSFDIMLPVDNNEESIYKINSITPTEEFAKFLKDNNLELDVTYENLGVVAGAETIAVNCNFKNDKIANISGDIDLLNINFEVVSDLHYQAMTEIMSIGQGEGFDFESKIAYEDAEGNSQKINVLNNNKGVVKVDNSYIIGTVVPEGSADEDGYMQKTLQEMGTEVKIIAPDGSVTIPNLDAGYMGYIQCDTIPVMDGIYKIVSQTPGHLSATSEEKLSYSYNGEMFGAYNEIMPIDQFGGDVNGDGVIDIIDAVIIARAIDRQVPAVEGIYRDINIDNNINATDLDYVVRNFAIVDGLREGIATVQREFNGMNIDDVVARGNELYEEDGPEITINIEDGKAYNAPINLEVTSRDIVYSTHKVYVNGELFEGSNIYQDGAYEVKVEAMDDLGNKSEKIVNFSIKTIGPKVNISGVEDGKVYDKPVKPVIEVEEGAETTITLNDESYDGNEISAVGKYILKVVAKDKAENVTEVTIQFEIVNKQITDVPDKPNGGEGEKPSNNNGSNSGGLTGNNQAKPGMPITGAIIGSAVIIVVAVCMVVVGILLFKKKKK